MTESNEGAGTSSSFYKYRDLLKEIMEEFDFCGCLEVMIHSALLFQGVVSHVVLMIWLSLLVLEHCLRMVVDVLHSECS